MSELWGERGASAVGAAKGRGAWFTESRFGLFIHWGLFSEAAGVWQGKTWYGIAEWLMCQAQITAKDYATLATRFNPIRYNPREWVRLAKDAGMKYLVITAKHHEGFAMFKSAVSPFNIVDASPYGRDPLKELAEACAAENMKLGFYYSQYFDWHEPDAAGNWWEFKQEGDFNKYLYGKVMPQLEELLTQYGPVALLWFDTPGSIPREASQAILDRVRQLQPDCLVNSRIGHGLGDYATLGDQEIPLTAPDCVWETIDTHNDTWAYAAADHNWKGPKELISRLVRVISLGGNYMLNVGPDGQGTIPDASAEILRQVGAWTMRNAEGLYAVGSSPIRQQAWGCCTTRPGKLYVHVLHWPLDGELLLPYVQADVTNARMLVSGQALAFRHGAYGLVINLPERAPDEPAVIVVLDIAGKPTVSKTADFLYNGLVNAFEAPFANLDRCQLGKRSWMEKFGDWHHAQVIEHWQAGSRAAWPVTATKPGMFALYATYECLPEAENAEFALSLGETRLTFPALCTTGGKAFNRTRLRRECIGKVVIAHAGDFQVAIECLSIPAGDGFILQNVILEPVV